MAETPLVVHLGGLNFKHEAFGTGNRPPWTRGPEKGLGVRGKCNNPACEVATSPHSCIALYPPPSEYHLRGDLPLCPLCNKTFQPISLYFHDCDASFTLKVPDQAVCREGPFHCPKGKWSVLEVREVDPKFTMLNFELEDRAPELKEGMSNQDKQQACQQMASEVVVNQKKIIAKFESGLSYKEKVALKRQALEAAKQADKVRAEKLESAETDLKRVDKAVDNLKPLISEAKTLADLEAPGEAIDRAKKDVRVVAAQRDELVHDVNTEKKVIAEAQNEHAAVMWKKEAQLRDAEVEVKFFKQRAKEVTKSLRSFFSRTFGEGTKFLKASLQVKVAANAGKLVESEDEKQVQDSLKAVEDLLATLHKESEESKNIQDNLEQLRASLAAKEVRVNDLSSWVGRVLVNLEALEAELDAKIEQLDE